ncbi:hypothetical protein FOY51_24870 [Antrihabitans cavernicola]|uniref:Uncharacterized protein n=1 Tax=Antrihabitans cavernicola TaxID=2495913 RepID=A0A5A7S3W5_9NOCA|nr:hypothetical protein FOY51_24870 [Spelaeibacter cavernicola]
MIRRPGPLTDSTLTGSDAANSLRGADRAHTARKQFAGSLFLDMPTMQQPEAYVGDAAAFFGEDGTLTNTSTSDFLAGFLRSFADWTDRTGSTPR